MSKLQRLRNNITVLDHALNGNNEPISASVRYTGFGGMAFILNPADKAYWSKSDLVYYDDTMRLQKLIRDYASSEKEYERLWQSLKASTLTAYYTPNSFVYSLMDELFGYDFSLKESKPNWIKPTAFLDPAAGSGVFIIAAEFSSLLTQQGTMHITAFEKDLLTAILLKKKFTGKSEFVYADGFEHFPADELGKYDMVSTNVPFGDIAVFDPEYTNSNSKVRRDAAKFIHRYYVLKGLDTLHDGGIEAYIITSNYLNKDGEQIAEVLKKARLIGAYRLANNLFKEHGTETGTDLLILQKDASKKELTADESFLLTQYEDEGCPTNMYFTMHPDHIIATSSKKDTDNYGKPGFVYNHKAGVLGITFGMRKVLDKDLTANVDVKLFEKGKVNAMRSSKQSGHKAKSENKYAKQEKALGEIYEAYKKLYDHEATEMIEDVKQRKQLNKFYDDYVDKYGLLNSEPNKSICKRVNKELLALEVRSGMSWVKSDVMLKPVAFSTDEIHNAETPQDALAQSLNDYGYPNMKVMAAQTGMDESELLLKLDGDVYWNPVNEKYEITAKFVSGNVIEKINAIRKKYDIPENSKSEKEALAKQDIDPRVLLSLRALEDAVPTPIPFEELDFNLGERWIDTKLYSDFGSEFFSMPGSAVDRWGYNKVKVDVKYDPILDQFAAAADHSWNEKITSQYYVESECSRYNGMQLYVHALQNTCPKMMRYKRDKDGSRIKTDGGNYIKEEDPEKTQLANAKIEEIRNGWVDWLTQQPKDVKDELAKAYNEKFNCFVKPHYDGSHQKFPGLDLKGLGKKYGIKDLYQSQKDCIWMLVQNQGGICDHEVGSGKTLIMCIAAHEMKRLGLVHKPMIIGLKANVNAIAETYRTCYPKAKILYAQNKDFHESERVAFFNNMKNNDYDCVIMSHDQFGRLPQSEEVQEDVLQDELNQLEDAMKAARTYGYSNSRQILRGLERRKRNLESKILDVQNSIRKHTDKVVDFKKMGIDHIFVDESHMFKNLGFSTRHDRVAGLGNTEGSKRAFNLLMAIRTIQQRTNKDLGATFLSGTTVTNSLTELYSLFRYLRPRAMAKQGITCFDAWAAIFTKKSTEFEFSLTNQIILKERFRYFIKVPELAQFYNEITDFRTAEDVGIERPKKHARLLNIEPTPDQAEFINTLMKFAETGDFALIGKYDVTEAQQRAKMLYATDMARKMSLDMRMIDPSYSDHPRSKSSMCAKLVKMYYDKYDKVKGTQLIFSDLSTYQGKGKGWNVYEDIKRKLIDMGVPSSEVRFIQECHNERQKQQMIDDTNAGKIRVLFGSTSMLGTGVNCQKRVVAVHHLDTPWRPSDLEQRDGRAIRKGNEIAKKYADNTVEIIIYAVRRSLDAYKFGLLNNKQTFISQLKRGQLSVRTLDEGAMDEKSGMNFAEYMAVLSGNTDLLERAKLEKHIAALEAERKSFYREKSNQERKQANLKEENITLGKNIKDAESDLKLFEENARKAGDGTVLNSISIDGFEPYVLDKDGKPVGVKLTPEDGDEFDMTIGKALLKIDRTARTNYELRQIGEVYGFPVSVKTKEYHMDGMVDYVNQFYVNGKRLVYSVNADGGHSQGCLIRSSARKSARMPLETLQRLPKMIARWKEKRQMNAAHIEQLDTIINLVWGKDDELSKLRKDLSALDLKINQSLHKDGKDGEYKKAA